MKMVLFQFAVRIIKTNHKNIRQFDIYKAVVSPPQTPSTNPSLLTHVNGGSWYQRASHGPDHPEVPGFLVGVVPAAAPEEDMENPEDTGPRPGSVQV